MKYDKNYLLNELSINSTSIAAIIIAEDCQTKKYLIRVDTQNVLSLWWIWYYSSSLGIDFFLELYLIFTVPSFVVDIHFNSRESHKGAYIVNLEKFHEAFLQSSGPDVMVSIYPFVACRGEQWDRSVGVGWSGWQYQVGAYRVTRDTKMLWARTGSHIQRRARSGIVNTSKAYNEWKRLLGLHLWQEKVAKPRVIRIWPGEWKEAWRSRADHGHFSGLNVLGRWIPLAQVGILRWYKAWRWVCVEQNTGGVLGSTCVSAQLWVARHRWVGKLSLQCHCSGPSFSVTRLTLPRAVAHHHSCPMCLHYYFFPRTTCYVGS